MTWNVSKTWRTADCPDFEPCVIGVPWDPSKLWLTQDCVVDEGIQDPLEDILGQEFRGYDTIESGLGLGGCNTTYFGQSFIDNQLRNTGTERPLLPSRCWDFSGTANRVNSDISAAADYPISLGVRFSPGGVIGAHCVMSINPTSGTSHYFGPYQTGAQMVMMRRSTSEDTTTLSGFTVVAGIWYDLVVTYLNATQFRWTYRTYDGVSWGAWSTPAIETDVSKVWPANMTKLMIAALRAGSPTWHWEGQISRAWYSPTDIAAPVGFEGLPLPTDSDARIFLCEESPNAFDATSANDSSGNGGIGALTGDIGTTYGNSSNSVEMSANEDGYSEATAYGAGKYATAPFTLGTPDRLTVKFRFRTIFGTTRYLWDCRDGDNDGALCYIGVGGGLTAFLRRAGSDARIDSSSSGFNDGRWHYIVLEDEGVGGNFTMTVDGNLEGSEPRVQVEVLANLRIAAHYAAGSNFEGEISDFEVDVTGTVTTKAWYRDGGGRGRDWSGNGHALTVTGVPLQTTIPVDLKNPTQDVAGGLLLYAGQAPQDAYLYSQVATFAAGDFATGSTSDFDLPYNGPWSIAARVKVSGSALGTVCGNRKESPAFVGWQVGVNMSQTGAVQAGSVALQAVSDWGTGNRLIVATGGGVAINDGNWHSIVFTYDGSTNAAGVRCYIDGIEVPLTAGYDSLSGAITAVEPFTVGKRSWQYVGEIQDIAIDEVAEWTPDQVYQYHDSRILLSTVSTIPLDEGTGTTSTVYLAGGGTSTLNWTIAGSIWDNVDGPVSVDGQTCCVHGDRSVDFAPVNSPYRQRILNAGLADTLYDAGDGHQPGTGTEVILARVAERLSTGSTVNVGTVASGTHSSTHIDDGVHYQITETAGTPGFDVEVTIAVTGPVPAKLLINGRYDGNIAHTVNVDIYNHDTSLWDTLGSMASVGTDQDYEFDIADPSYVNAGDVTIRFQHVSAGDITHALYLDHVRIVGDCDDRLSVWLPPTDDSTALAWAS